MKPLEVLPGPVPPPSGHSDRGVGLRNRTFEAGPAESIIRSSSTGSASSLLIVGSNRVVLGFESLLIVAAVALDLSADSMGAVPGGVRMAADSVGNNAEGGSALVSGSSGSPELI